MRVVLLRQLDCGFNRFRTTGDEENLRQAVRSKIRYLAGKLDRRWRQIGDRSHIVKLLELPGDRGGDLGISIAE
jgi:hypothetical protein